MNQERIKTLIITYLQYINLQRLARELDVGVSTITNLMKGEKLSDKILTKIREGLVKIGDELMEANIEAGRK